MVLLLSAGLDVEESSSVATAGGSDDQLESTDSASFSIPSLELSDGVVTTGNSLDVEDGLSSSYSALGAEGCSPSTEVPSLQDEAALEAAGEASMLLKLCSAWCLTALLLLWVYFGMTS